MMNPSHANKIQSDDTVNFMINCLACEYDNIIIINTSPIVGSSQDIFDVIWKDQTLYSNAKYKENFNKINQLLNGLTSYDCLAATGLIKNINSSQYQSILKILNAKNYYAFGLYNNGESEHLSHLKATSNKNNKVLNNFKGLGTTHMKHINKYRASNNLFYFK